MTNEPEACSFPGGATPAGRLAPTGVEAVTIWVTTTLYGDVGAVAFFTLVTISVKLGGSPLAAGCRNAGCPGFPEGDPCAFAIVAPPEALVAPAERLASKRKRRKKLAIANAKMTKTIRVFALVENAVLSFVMFFALTYDRNRCWKSGNRR